MVDRHSRPHDSPRRRRPESSRSAQQEELSRSRAAPVESSELPRAPQFHDALSYDSSSSSYIDISRTLPPERTRGLNAIRAFFTSPSERRRVRRRRSRAIFAFGNASSSSVNSDLAYGTGYIRRPKGELRKGKRRAREDDIVAGPDGMPPRRRRSTDLSSSRPSGRASRAGLSDDAAILALGAEMAALARKNNRQDLKDGRRSGGIPLVGQSSARMAGPGMSRGLGLSKPSHGPDEDGWESATDADSETSSVDSRLAYGYPSKEFFEHRRLQRRKSIVDPALFGPENSLHGLLKEPVGFRDDTVDREYLSDFVPPTVAELQKRGMAPSAGPSSAPSDPLQYVYPIPTSDPNSFDAAGSSVFSGPEAYISRSGPTIQAPQPILPITSSVLEPSVSARDTKVHTGRANSLAGAALAGVAGIGIAAALSSDSKGDRKDGGKRRDEVQEKPRERRRDDPKDKDEDRKKRGERRQERERERTRDEPDKERRRKRAEEDRDRLDGTRSERRREKLPAFEATEEKPEKRREPLDPFQFQVADDAFNTPDGTRNAEPITSIQRARSPAIVTVERVPKFARNRVSSIGDKSAEPIGDAKRENDPEIGSEKDRDEEREEERGRDRKSRHRERESRDKERTEREADQIYEETRHFTAPIAEGAISASVAVEMIEEDRRSRSSKGKRRRKIESNNGEEDPIQAEANRIYRETIRAQKIAAEHNDDPVPRIKTPPEMAHKKKESKYDAPNADFELDHVTDAKEVQTSPIKLVGSFSTNRSVDPAAIAALGSTNDLKRPLLNLIRPTPTPSPAPEQERSRSERRGSSREETSNKESPSEGTREVEPVVDDVVTKSTDTPVRRSTSTGSGKGVTWGKNETMHYNVESPDERKDDPMERSVEASEVKEKPKMSAAKKASAWGALKGAFMSGAAAEVVAKAEEAAKSSQEPEFEKAIGSEGPRSDKGANYNISAPDKSTRTEDARSEKSVGPNDGKNVKDRSFEYRGVVVEPEPDYRDVGDRGPPPVGPKPSKAQSSHMPGAFEDDIDFTATVAAGLERSGFDPEIVIKDPTYRRRSSPPGSQEPLAGYKQPYSETVSDLGSYVDVSGIEKARDVKTGNDGQFGTEISDKEQRKLDKAAKRQSRDLELQEESPVSSQIVGEPESYATSSKSGKKDKKRDSSEKSDRQEKSKRSKDSYDDDQPREKRNSKVTVPIDAFDDLRSEISTRGVTDDGSSTPKKTKRSKREDDQFDSPSRSMSATDIASSMEKSSSRKSKDKSSRRSSRSYDSEPNPEDVPLPLASEVSRDSRDDDYESRRSLKSSKRSGSVPDVLDRDTRSVKSSNSKYEDAEDSKKKDKKNGGGGGGFFGLFGSSTSKSEPDRERSKDKEDYPDPNPKKNKKSKRNSTGDGTDISEISATSNGNGHSSYDNDYGEAKRAANGNSKSGKVDGNEDSFLGNAGTLGEGVGLAAAVAIAAHQHQQSKAAHADMEEAAQTSSVPREFSTPQQSAFDTSDDIISKPMQEKTAESALDTFQDDMIDPDIAQRHSRPCIDPYYRDYLPLPPSDPSSPNVEPIDELPELPASQPGTPPRTEAYTSRKIVPPMVKTPSTSAIPIQYIIRNRSTPSSPALSRPASMTAASPSPTSPDALVPQKARPRPVSWDSKNTKEIRPLLLLDPSRSGSAGHTSDPERATEDQSTDSERPSGRSGRSSRILQLEARSPEVKSTEDIPKSDFRDFAESYERDVAETPLTHVALLTDFPDPFTLPALPDSRKSTPAICEPQIVDPSTLPQLPDIRKSTPVIDESRIVDHASLPQLPDSRKSTPAIDERQIVDLYSLPALPDSRKSTPAIDESQVVDHASFPQLPDSRASTPAKVLDISALPALPLSRASTPMRESEPAEQSSVPESYITKSGAEKGNDRSKSLAAAVALAGTAFGVEAGAVAASSSHHDEEKEADLVKTLPAEELPEDFRVEPDTKDRSSYLFQATPPTKGFGIVSTDASPNVQRRELETLSEDAQADEYLIGDKDSPTRIIKRGRKAALEALSQSTPENIVPSTSTETTRDARVPEAPEVEMDAAEVFSFIKSKKDKKNEKKKGLSKPDTKDEPLSATVVPSTMADTSRDLTTDESFVAKSEKAKNKDKRKAWDVEDEISSSTTQAPAAESTVRVTNPVDVFSDPSMEPTTTSTDLGAEPEFPAKKSNKDRKKDKKKALDWTEPEDQPLPSTAVLPSIASASQKVYPSDEPSSSTSKKNKKKDKKKGKSLSRTSTWEEVTPAEPTISAEPVDEDLLKAEQTPLPASRALSEAGALSEIDDSEAKKRDLPEIQGDNQQSVEQAEPPYLIKDSKKSKKKGRRSNQVQVDDKPSVATTTTETQTANAEPARSVELADEDVSRAEALPLPLSRVSSEARLEDVEPPIEDRSPSKQDTAEPIIEPSSTKDFEEKEKKDRIYFESGKSEEQAVTKSTRAEATESVESEEPPIVESSLVEPAQSIEPKDEGLSRATHTPLPEPLASEDLDQEPTEGGIESADTGAKDVKFAQLERNIEPEADPFVIKKTKGKKKKGKLAQTWEPDESSVSEPLATTELSDTKPTQEPAKAEKENQRPILKEELTEKLPIQEPAVELTDREAHLDEVRGKDITATTNDVPTPTEEPPFIPFVTKESKKGKKKKGKASQSRAEDEAPSLGSTTEATSEPTTAAPSEREDIPSLSMTSSKSKGKKKQKRKPVAWGDNEPATDLTREDSTSFQEPVLQEGDRAIKDSMSSSEEPSQMLPDKSEMLKAVSRERKSEEAITHLKESTEVEDVPREKATIGEDLEKSLSLAPASTVAITPSKSEPLALAPAKSSSAEYFPSAASLHSPRNQRDIEEHAEKNYFPSAARLLPAVAVGVAAVAAISSHDTEKDHGAKSTDTVLLAGTEQSAETVEQTPISIKEVVQSEKPITEISSISREVRTKDDPEPVSTIVSSTQEPDIAEDLPKQAPLDYFPPAGFLRGSSLQSKEESSSNGYFHSTTALLPLVAAPVIAPEVNRLEQKPELKKIAPEGDPLPPLPPLGPYEQDELLEDPKDAESALNTTSKDIIIEPKSKAAESQQIDTSIPAGYGHGEEQADLSPKRRFKKKQVRKDTLDTFAHADYLAQLQQRPANRVPTPEITITEPSPEQKSQRRLTFVDEAKDKLQYKELPPAAEPAEDHGSREVSHIATELGGEQMNEELHESKDVLSDREIASGLIGAHEEGKETALAQHTVGPARDTIESAEVKRTREGPFEVVEPKAKQNDQVDPPVGSELEDEPKHEQLHESRADLEDGAVAAGLTDARDEPKDRDATHDVTDPVFNVTGPDHESIHQEPPLETSESKEKQGYKETSSTVAELENEPKLELKDTELPSAVTQSKDVEPRAEATESKDEEKDRELPAQVTESSREVDPITDNQQPDGLAAGYKEDQVLLAKQLQEGFSAGSKKPKKGKKGRGTSTTPKGDSGSSPSYFEEPNPVEGQHLTEFPQEFAAEDRDGTSTQNPEGVAAGFTEEQLEAARQMREDFSSGSKKPRKGKKRQSLIRTATDDNIPESPADGVSGDASVATTDVDSAIDSPLPLSSVATGDELDPFGFTTRKGKKSSKKRQSLLQSSAHESEASADPTRESSRDPGSKRLEDEVIDDIPIVENLASVTTELTDEQSSVVPEEPEPELFSYTTKKGKKGGRKEQSSSQEEKVLSEPTAEIKDLPASKDESGIFDKTLAAGVATAAGIAALEFESSSKSKKGNKAKKAKKAKGKDISEPITPQEDFSQQPEREVVEEEQKNIEQPAEESSMADKIWGSVVPPQTILSETEKPSSNESEDPLRLFPDKKSKKVKNKKGKAKSIPDPDPEPVRTKPTLPVVEDSDPLAVLPADNISNNTKDIQKEEVHTKDVLKGDVVNEPERSVSPTKISHAKPLDVLDTDTLSSTILDSKLPDGPRVPIAKDEPMVDLATRDLSTPEPHVKPVLESNPKNLSALEPQTIPSDVRPMELAETMVQIVSNQVSTPKHEAAVEPAAKELFTKEESLREPVIQKSMSPDSNTPAHSAEVLETAPTTIKVPESESKEMSSGNPVRDLEDKKPVNKSPTTSQKVEHPIVKDVAEFDTENYDEKSAERRASSYVVAPSQNVQHPIENDPPEPRIEVLNKSDERQRSSDIEATSQKIEHPVVESTAEPDVAVLENSAEREKNSDIVAITTAVATGVASAALVADSISRHSKEKEKKKAEALPAAGSIPVAAEIVTKAPTPSNTKSKKSKKGKERAKALNRSVQEEDMFDDPMLWEGAQPQRFSERSVEMEAGDDGDFWSAPAEDEETAIDDTTFAEHEPLGELAHKRERSASLMAAEDPSPSFDHPKTRRKHDYEDIPAAIARDVVLERETIHEPPTSVDKSNPEPQIKDVPDDNLAKSLKKSKKSRKQNRMEEWDTQAGGDKASDVELSSKSKSEPTISQHLATVPVQEISRSVAETTPKIHVGEKTEVHEPGFTSMPTARKEKVVIDKPDLRKKESDPEQEKRRDDAKARRRGQEMYIPPPTTLPAVIEEEADQHDMDRAHLRSSPNVGERDISDKYRDSGLVTVSPIPSQRVVAHDYEHARDSGVHMGDTPKLRSPAAFSDDVLARLSWPTVDEKTETVNLDRSQRQINDQSSIGQVASAVAVGAVVAGAAHLASTALRTPPKERQEKREEVDRSISISPNIGRLQTPDHAKYRPSSVGSNRSLVSNRSGSTPGLRRSDRKLSSDLRSLSQRSQPNLAKDAKEAAAKEAESSPATSIINANPIANEGRVRVKDMANVYDGFGEGRIGSPMSPTRPHSMRRRQSMQVLDLERRIEDLAAENRMLAEAKESAERNLSSAQRATLALADREAEVDSLKQTLDWLQREVERLKEVNDGLDSANAQLARQHNDRYGSLEAQHTETSRELDEMRHSHGSLTAATDAMILEKVSAATAEKDREISRLMGDLDSAQEKIRELQRQILETKSSDGDFLVLRDEDYFDNACQQLCQHVQQWVLRFSKFSDMRACRLTTEINNTKIIDRLDNAVLDGSDVDEYLSDRVKRRDVFMSMTMTMIWEYVFTRYLFGMDREQRQKLKTLEKTLMEVGPQGAVHQWRATTLALLAKRKSFHAQREQDTEAVVQMIFQTLSEILPPPTQLEAQIQQQLNRVMKAAVDLSIEMRTQRAEYMMLPPLQPEYDANGELSRQVFFNAALMNERSGDTVSNEELEAEKAVVRVVLFPLVVKKGDDNGNGDEEIVVCPAQVLVAKSRKQLRPSGGGMGMGQPNHSAMSMQSGMPANPHDYEGSDADVPDI